MPYAASAILAAKFASKNKISPAVAWENAVKHEFPTSLNNQQKGCPKSTFLGLCEEGLIKGVNGGVYTRSDLNKQYGVVALRILASAKSRSFKPIELWEAVLQKLNVDQDKRHNHQMNVVLALWLEGLLNI